MDFVLGYGAYTDPAGEMVTFIEQAREAAREKGRYLCIVGSVCGTEQDPQNRTEQEARLRKAGVIVMPSNARAVKLAAEITGRLE